MTEPYIGAWVRRARSGSRGHHVESVVAGDAIVHCGYRMAPEDASGRALEVHNGEVVSRASRPLDWDLCKRCR